MKYLIEKVTLVGANGVRLKNIHVKATTNDLQLYRQMWWEKYPHAEAINLTYQELVKTEQKELKTTKELYNAISDFD